MTSDAAPDAEAQAGDATVDLRSEIAGEVVVGSREGAAMTLAEFKQSQSKVRPPAGLSVALAALWWAGKDDWDKAHQIVIEQRTHDSSRGAVTCFSSS